MNLYGEPSRTLDRMHNASLEYSIVESPRKALVLTTSLLYHSNNKDMRQNGQSSFGDITRDSRNWFNTLNPSLNIYGTIPLDDDTRVEADVTGSYLKGNYYNLMAQSPDYFNRTDSKTNAYNVRANIYFQHRFPWASLYFDFSESLADSRIEYYLSSGNNQLQKFRRYKTSTSVALTGYLRNILTYFIAGGVSNTYQPHYKDSQTNPYAYVMLQKNFPKGFNIQYDFIMRSSNPGFVELSDAVIPVNEILYRTGNNILKDRLSITNQLTGSYYYKKLSLNLSVQYSTDSNIPFTEIQYIDNPNNYMYGKFLESTVNGKFSSNFNTQIYAGLSNLFNHLSLQAYGSYEMLRQKGLNATYKKNFFRFGGYASAYFGNWQVFTRLDLMPDYGLLGNRVWRNYTSWTLGGSWHKGPWSISLSMTDLFTKKAYYQKSTVTTDNYQYVNEYWIADKNNMVSISLRYLGEFGVSKKRANRNLKIDSKVDTGVQ